jgi:hypothetical protein
MLPVPQLPTSVHPRHFERALATSDFAPPNPDIPLRCANRRLRPEQTFHPMPPDCQPRIRPHAAIDC